MGFFLFSILDQILLLSNHGRINHSRDRINRSRSRSRLLFLGLLGATHDRQCHNGHAEHHHDEFLHLLHLLVVFCIYVI